MPSLFAAGSGRGTIGAIEGGWRARRARRPPTQGNGDGMVSTHGAAGRNRLAGRLAAAGGTALALAALAASVAAPAPALAQTVRNVVYRCPGNPVLYTDAISEKEARERGCRTIEGAPITVIQSQRPRAGTPVPPVAAATRGPTMRVDPNEQRARDADRRAILGAELRREEQALAELLREFNGGEPERRGDERNFQKYQERVAEMKASIARKESDVAAIKRELAKTQ